MTHAASLSAGNAISVVRVVLADADPATMKSIHFRIKSAMEEFGGLIDLGFWRHIGDLTGYLSFTTFGSMDELLAAQDAVARGSLYTEAETTMALPPDVMRFEVVQATGTTAMPIGSCASTSIRMASPGHGDEVVEELARIFAELEALPGFEGGIIAKRLHVPDELIGIALWSDPRDYRASLPKHEIHKVELYERFL